VQPWKFLAATAGVVSLVGFASATLSEELGSCVVDRSATAAAVVCAIAPGPGAKLVTLTVKTGTPEGVGPATMTIDNPNANPATKIVDLDEVNLVIEDDFAYGIWFQDINFDGYIDFAITEFLPAGPNALHLYWLFAPLSKRYIPNEELRKITSPLFDPDRKRIGSQWRGGCCNHGATVYAWRGEFVVRIRDAECELVAENSVETIKFSEWSELDGLSRPIELDTYEACLVRLEGIK